MKKRVLTTFIITLIITACMIPAVVSAESYAAKVNGQKYTDYKDAWDAVKDGGTIEMLEDWNVSKFLEVPKNVTITIKMNEHTIDRGLITTDAEGNEKHQRKVRGNVIIVQEGTTLKLYDGTITGGCNSLSAGGIHQKKTRGSNFITCTL